MLMPILLGSGESHGKSQAVIWEGVGGMETAGDGAEVAR